MTKARCIRPCWDSRITKYYWQGEEADIQPGDIIAHHFEFLEPVPKLDTSKDDPVPEPGIVESEFEPIKPPEPKGRMGKRPTRK